MGEDASHLRAEIAATRAQISDTVEALEYKTDVKARVGDVVRERAETVRERVEDIRDEFSGAMAGVANGQFDTDRAKEVTRAALRGPWGIVVGAILLAAITGWFARSSRD